MGISVVAALVVIFDYMTKRAIVAKVIPNTSVNILPFLRIVHVENPGAAFGLFSNLGNNIFMVISVIAIIAVLIYLFRFAKGLEVSSLSLILGGAIGNLIDRLKTGKVVDFIDLHVGQWHWPAFNIADSALTIGIALFIWSNIRSGTIKEL